MFNYVLHFSDYLSSISLFRYLTFRSAAAVLTSALYVLFLGPSFIRFVKSKQNLGQPIRSDGPSTHFKKAGTPTMGGGLILSSIVLSSLFWSHLDNLYVWLVLGIMICFGMIGFYDDYLKITYQNNKGFSAWLRLLLEFIVGGLAATIVYRTAGSNLAIPFFKSVSIDLGLFFILFSAFVIVGSGNAVNFTDGLDGLAITLVMITAATFSLITYVCGNYVFSTYLQISYVPGGGELSVLLGSVVGASLGFLWFNAQPASIIKGDTGSLALGGGLGAISIVTNHEIVLAIVGGIFVMEAVSVILQVFWFKTTGKRLFLMAPIHHHFEKKGWTESQVVIRFWIIAIMLALIGLSTLKLR